jgi:hypothetical protein
MANPYAHYPGNCTFESRINAEAAAKQRVADRVAQDFLGDGQSAFISDGSSTFYVGLSLFEAKRDSFTLVTNSLPIAHEFHFWLGKKWHPSNFDVRLLGGKLIPDLMMAASVDDEAFKKAIDNVGVMVLSIAGFFTDYGPAGRETDSLRIKKLALTRWKDTNVVLVADHAKFCEPLKGGSPPGLPLIYANRASWNELLQTNENLYVATTLPPGCSRYQMSVVGRDIASGVKAPSNAEDFYAQNTHLLRLALKDRFIEMQ